MNTYLKKIARFILKDELIKTQESHLEREALLEEKFGMCNELGERFDAKRKEVEKLEKKIKRMESPENILVSYYRIDNVAADGLPPSYLNPQDKSEYIQKVGELESVYRSVAFREMMAWALNFHANISVSGKIKNEMGDEINISSQSANDMIRGMRAIWDLLVAAHNKDSQLSRNRDSDAYAALAAETEYE